MALGLKAGGGMGMKMPMAAGMGSFASMPVFQNNPKVQAAFANAGRGMQGLQPPMSGGGLFDMSQQAQLPAQPMGMMQRMRNGMADPRFQMGMGLLAQNNPSMQPLMQGIMMNQMLRNGGLFGQGG